MVCSQVYDFVRWTDWYPNPTRPAWLNLMNQLILTPGQEGPRYRIGGNSGDLTVYDISPLPKLPSGEPIIHSLNSTELQSWKQALAHINSKAVLDLNFRRGDNASWAVSYVEAIDKYIGWDMTVAMEVGNEVSRRRHSIPPQLQTPSSAAERPLTTSPLSLLPCCLL